MYSEYLYNNDTQDICRRVCELAATNEPALRAHCQEVSRQTDTSSLCLQKDCVAQVNVTNAVLSIIEKNLRDLSQALSKNAGVFRTQNGKADFPTVCQTVVQMEEARLHLLECITALTQIRKTIASSVAEANRSLHLLSIAGDAVFEDVRPFYKDLAAHIQVAYTRLTELDATVREAQSLYMALVERFLPIFMERLRTAADFNHAGEALDGAAICTLCGEFLVQINRVQNVSF